MLSYTVLGFHCFIIAISYNKFSPLSLSLSLLSKGYSDEWFPLLTVVMSQLMKDKMGQQADEIEKFAKSIKVPTLVLWGENDQV